MKTADLHIHTRYSDSSLTPQDVVDQAVKAKLSCISITDHDTIDGIAPTREAARAAGIEVLSGVELSTELDGRDIHVLGYCFDDGSGEFKNGIEEALNSRWGRMIKMVEKLQELGMETISMADVEAMAGSRALGRPHLARVMMDKGYVNSLQEAFDKYLADDAPAYIPKLKQTPSQAINMIKRAKGVSVLAHPMITQMDEIIPRLVREGLDGLEVYYPNTSSVLVEFYEGLARKHDLLMTGGSDAHGEFKQNSYVGKMKIQYELVDKIKERAGA